MQRVNCNLIILTKRIFSKVASTIFFICDISHLVIRAVKQIRGCVAISILFVVYYRLLEADLCSTVYEVISTYHLLLRSSWEFPNKCWFGAIWQNFKYSNWHISKLAYGHRNGWLCKHFCKIIRQKTRRGGRFSINLRSIWAHAIFSIRLGDIK